MAIVGLQSGSQLDGPYPFLARTAVQLRCYSLHSALLRRKLMNGSFFPEKAGRSQLMKRAARSFSHRAAGSANQPLDRLQEGPEGQLRPGCYQIALPNQALSNNTTVTLAGNCVPPRLLQKIGFLLVRFTQQYRTRFRVTVSSARA